MKMNKTITPEQVNDLVESSITTFNVGGFAPSASVFRLVPEQLKSQLLTCARTFIKDAKTVTLEVDYKHGSVGAFVWLPENSPNIQDVSTMSENSAVRKAIHRYSQALKEFMDRFSPEDSKRPFKDENGMKLVGIPVMIEKMLYIIFDKNGNQFRNTYGTQNEIRTKIRLSATFSKSDDNDHRAYGKLRYVEVYKGLDNDVIQREPRAQKSQKF